MKTLEIRVTAEQINSLMGDNILHLVPDLARQLERGQAIHVSLRRSGEASWGDYYTVRIDMPDNIKTK